MLPSRRRVMALTGLVLVIAAGLLVHAALPDTAVTDIAGDALYALVAYLLVVVLAPRLPAWAAGAIAASWCIGVELFQLTGIPLRAAAAFPPVVLVLGTVFDPRDLVVYAVSIAGAALLDTLLRALLSRGGAHGRARRVGAGHAPARVKAVSHPLRIAVVIPCRDDAEFLEPCLTALAAQTRMPDRVIVVDNASSDASADVARRHGAEVVREELVGIWPAAARGYDVAATDVDLIARLDADSRPHPDWLERVERAFRDDEGLGVLTGGAEFYGSNRLVHYLAEHWYIGGGHFWVNLWLGQPLVFGSNFAMRSDVWRRVEPFVARTNPSIHDDLDLTIRLRPADGIRYDRTLRMPVSSRPVVTQRGLWRRVGRVVTTFAASWPEGAAWRRAELDAPVPEQSAPELWPGEDETGLAPEFGR